MGFGSGAQQPTPPNPGAVSQAQTGSNIGTAIAQSYLGNANTYGPYGSTTYNQTGSHSINVPTVDVNGNVTGSTSYDIPQFSSNTTLAPAQQQMLDLQNQTGIGLNQIARDSTSRVGDLLGRGVDTSNLTNWSGVPTGPTNFQTANLQTQGEGSPLTMSVGPQDFSADRQAVTDAMMARVRPQLDIDRTSLETKLVNQGYARGSEAFNREMDAQNRQANDAYSQAVLSGGQEQSRLAGLQLNQAQFGNQAAGQQFSQDQSRLGFNNTVAGQDANAANQNAQQLYNNQFQNAQANNALRGQQLQEQYGLQSFPINQITALMSGGQIQQPQAPAYQSGQVQPTNVAGNVYNTAALNQQNYQQQLAQQNAMMGGLFGLGGSALGAAGRAGGFGGLFSDRRLKRDIVDTGIRLMNGLKLYAFKYIWDNVERVGVMAQDVVKVIPAAVHNVGGYGFVDYDMVMGT